MIRSSIRTKILAIAVGLIVLMVITAVLSLTLVTQVGHRLEQMTNSYIPAYGNLARGNIRSLERALALRRMVIAKSQSPPDQTTFSTVREVFDEKGAEVVREGQSARAPDQRADHAGDELRRCRGAGADRDAHRCRVG